MPELPLSWCQHCGIELPPKQTVCTLCASKLSQDEEIPPALEELIDKTTDEVQRKIPEN